MNSSAASFDCTKASTVIEKAICSDTELSKIDEDMSAIYAKVYAINPDIKSSQRDWLKNIKQCGDEPNVVSCLKEAYRIRLSGLNQLTDKNWGWIGFEIVDLVNTVVGQGLVVGKVSSNSPAELSGLKAGDVIYQINGNPIINAQANIGSIVATFATPPGETLSLKIINKNQSSSDLKIKAGVRPNTLTSLEDGAAIKDLPPSEVSTLANQVVDSTPSSAEAISPSEPHPEIDSEPIKSETNTANLNPVEINKTQPEKNNETAPSFIDMTLLLILLLISFAIYFPLKAKLENRKFHRINRLFITGNE